MPKSPHCGQSPAWSKLSNVATGRSWKSLPVAETPVGTSQKAKSKVNINLLNDTYRYLIT